MLNKISKTENQSVIFQQPTYDKKIHIIAVLVLALLVVTMFADVLFSFNPPVLSNQNADLADQYVHWRYFGFNQLKRGNLPLWNPHVFSGIPFFGGFQSALLYPPNLLYMVFPLGLAINIGIALHVFLAGFFMYLWTSYRGLKPLACWFSGVLLMFCGPFFMHIYAGHLSNICSMVWVPLIFLSIDGIFAKRTLGWVLVGVAAVAMFILAGHPQYVFYTMIAAMIYSALSLIKQSQRIRIIMLLGLMGLWAGLIVSIQLLTGFEEAAYTVRGRGGVPYEFAAMFSFAPENILTLVVPDFFGSHTDNSYWGRCYLWEMSLFFSVTGLVLAAYGRVNGIKQQRKYCTTMIVVLFILSLGAHTPLFKLLYAAVPGFNKFRGSSKFIFQMIIFMVMLAGTGLNRLLTGPKPSWKWIAVIASGCVFLSLAAIFIAILISTDNASGFWDKIMTHVHFLASKSHESYLPGKFYSDPDFIRSSAECASNSLWIAALMFALASGLFALLRRSIWAVYAMVLLAVLELWFFTRPVRPTFDLMQTKYPALAKMTELRQGDYRIFNTLNANSAMTTGTFDILGHDPGMLRRYSEFMYRTQRLNPDRATQSITCSQWHRLFAILRLRYVISYQDNNLHISALKEPPLPRLLLIDNYEVLKQRDEIFDRMFLPDYDFRSTVILESEPKPVPQPNAKDGSVKIVDETTDSLVIEADLSSPSILLVTDAYHPYWRIRSLVESTQDNYKILPANYILRAVPLSAGYHRFIMEYRPPLFNIGKWLTLISLSFYVLICGFFCYKKFRRAA